MIAMAVIAVGLLAMWNLHMVGLTSTAAGRRHTVAMALARELVSGLERLPFNDPLLDPDYAASGTADGPASGAPFGSLVRGDGTIRTDIKHEWTDGSTIVPGVRNESETRERLDALAGYKRRWTVWAMTSPSAPAGTAAGVKLIAVSVTWRDPPFARQREVVLYSQVVNAGSLVAGLANSQ
jgi:hypothetical protein